MIIRLPTGSGVNQIRIRIGIILVEDIAEVLISLGICMEQVVMVVLRSKVGVDVCLVVRGVRCVFERLRLPGELLLDVINRVGHQRLHRGRREGLAQPRGERGFERAVDGRIHGVSVFFSQTQQVRSVRAANAVDTRGVAVDVRVVFLLLFVFLRCLSVLLLMLSTGCFRPLHGGAQAGDHFRQHLLALLVQAPHCSHHVG
mmetsp:Transcript_25110/g.56474  ORF Transcript_25110/g.56474 Transcript_25110/m.56474 type:complete len:201 (-) Transcript_25110:3984-4586(-)